MFRSPGDEAGTELSLLLYGGKQKAGCFQFPFKKTQVEAPLLHRQEDRRLSIWLMLRTKNRSHQKEAHSEDPTEEDTCFIFRLRKEVTREKVNIYFLKEK